MRKSFLFVGILLAISACSSDERGQEFTAVRVENSNPFDFEAIQINDHQYGEVKAKTYSDYYIYEQIYSYAYINVKVNGKEYILQPIDYVGETPLSANKYTYQIAVDTTQKNYSGIALTLIKD